MALSWGPGSSGAWGILMTGEIFKEVKTPLAIELAEYKLLSIDINVAYNNLTLFYNKYPYRIDAAGDYLLISQSLFRDAIILFVGCFDKTASLHLSPTEIYTDKDNGLKYFAWL